MAVAGDFKLEHSIFRWTTKAPEGTEQMDTEEFVFHGCECRFNLDFSEGHYRLFIHCYPKPSKPFEVKVYFGCETNYVSYPKEIVKNRRFNRIWKLDTFEISKIIPDFEQHKLLHFKIMIHDSSDSSFDQSKTEDKIVQTPSFLDNSPCLESLSQDFSKLLDAQEGSHYSVELECGDHTLLAHRSVLISRSEVFSAMLQTDMVEGRSGRVNIQDMDFEIFQEFIRYLYTGKLPELTMDKAKDLYEAGDRYAVKSLKQRCANFLIENLTPENFCECLTLADVYSDQNLKESVMSYILEKKIPVDDEHWLAFCEEHPKLANEVLNRGYTLHCHK